MDNRCKSENSYEGKISNKELIFQLISLAIKHRKIMQNYLDETGVYEAQHRLLMEIFRNRNASQIDLARSMNVSAASVAVSLKKLEKGGYIARAIDEWDNRLNQITITEKGHRVVEQSKQIFESVDCKVFEGFSETEKQDLNFLLRKLDANLNRMEEEIKHRKGRT